MLPLALLAYLLVMAYVGRARLFAGEYLYYFGIIGVSLVIIVLLHFALKRRDRLRERRETDEGTQYGTYSDDKTDTKAT